jgi:hypothetical protein
MHVQNNNNTRLAIVQKKTATVDSV